MIPRALFSDDHAIFRTSVRRFVEAELVPHHAAWEEAGVVPRAVWEKAGEAGLLACHVEEAYGGPGCDFLFNVVVIEELARAGITGPGFNIHSDMVATYLSRFGSEALKQKWLPPMVRGTAIGALGLTEPDAGSDLRGLRTQARREGDHYVISGQKTFISNGQSCDFVLVAAKTDPSQPRGGVSLILVEADRPGFTRGRALKKLGMKAQDTSELFFDAVRVPAANLIGTEHGALRMLSHNLAHERLVQAVRSATAVEAMLAQTVDYVSQRKLFGQTLAGYQNTQFKLAELQAQAVAARVFVDRCIALQCEGALDAVDAAAAKLTLSDLHCKVADECLQLHGGAGYMWETPICRAYADARFIKIAGGAMEVMKMLIARSMFDDAADLDGRRAA